MHPSLTLLFILLCIPTWLTQLLDPALDTDTRQALESDSGGREGLLAHSREERHHPYPPG